MRIRLAVPDELDDQDRKAALDAALESVTRSNTPLIRSGKIPSAAAAIKAGKVEWRPEPPGDEHFDLPGTQLARGWGDCDDLAPWHAASLRASGVDPKARAIVRKSGPNRWHAIVRRGDGSIDDPSLAAGMGKNGHGVNGIGADQVVGAYAPIQPPMAADGRMCLAISPGRDPYHPGIWFARCDVPDRLEPWDWSSMAASHSPAKAILHAVTGCAQVAGEDMHPEDQARLGAFNDLLMGAHPEEVAEALHALMGDLVDADQVVGEAAQSVGFFGSLFKAIASPVTSTVKFVKHPSLKNLTHVFTDPVTTAAKAAAPLTSAIRFIPGVGPIAATAVDLINHPPTSFGALAKFAAAQGAGFIPGVGPIASELLKRGLPAAVQALAEKGVSPAALAPLLQQGGIPGLPGMLGPLMTAMQAGAHQQPARLLHAATASFDPGRVVRPWGPSGPAVMRF
jgi:hypothetical protein